VRAAPPSTATCQRLWRLQGRADESLFTSPLGGYLGRRWLRRYVLDPATEAAGVPWVTFHFRHTCASLLFAAGKSPKQCRCGSGTPTRVHAVRLRAPDGRRPGRPTSSTRRVVLSGRLRGRASREIRSAQRSQPLPVRRAHSGRNSLPMIQPAGDSRDRQRSPAARLIQHSPSADHRRAHR
jgi:hypothetical protein